MEEEAAEYWQEYSVHQYGAVSDTGVEI